MDAKKAAAFGGAPLKHPGKPGQKPQMGKKAPPFPPKGGDKGKSGKPAPGQQHDEAEEGDHDEEAEGDAGDDAHIVAETKEDLADGKADQEILDLTDGYDPELDGNPPEFVEDEETWDRAKTAVGPEDESEADDYWALIAHVYKRMGGKLKGKADGAHGHEHGGEG